MSLRPGRDLGESHDCRDGKLSLQVVEINEMWVYIEKYRLSVSEPKGTQGQRAAKED